MQGPSPDLFGGPDADEPQPGSPYARSTIDRLSFTLKLREKGYRDTALLRAFELAPRESFAPRRYADLARRDMALPLPCGQSMTAPLALARMLTVAGIESGHRVLEVGTGSGYLAAVLSHLAGEVVSVERYRSLAMEAEGKTRAFGLDNIAIHRADGLSALNLGRFDRIIVDGRVTQWPETLIAALSPAGRLVASHGEPGEARLTVLHLSYERERHEERFERFDPGALEAGLPAAL